VQVSQGVSRLNRDRGERTMADMAHSGHSAASAHETTHEHPAENIYIKVAAVLLAITVIEVIIYYVQWLHDHKVIGPTLLVLSSIKFVTVVGYFMHLKFDDRRLSFVFGGALLLSLAIVVALYILLQHHGIDYTTSGMIK
jgi:cytochrome c oxidase subunit 4